MQHLSTLFTISIISACQTTASNDSDARPIEDPGGGAHHHFVIDELSWPAHVGEARDYAFDVDGDGDVENQLGELPYRLSQLFSFVSTHHYQISRGELLLLADLHTKDPIAADDASFTLFVGKDPMPSACTAGTCGGHLTGTASFAIAGSPRETPLRGSIVQRTFVGERGALPVQFSIFESSPITVTLRGAQAKLFIPSLGGLSGTIGGAVLETDVTSKIYPAIQQGLTRLIARDCALPRVPPTCGCSNPSSEGHLAIGFFDTAPNDCSVTSDEIASSAFGESLLSDVGIDGQRAISVAFALTAVEATFRP